MTAAFEERTTLPPTGESVATLLRLVETAETTDTRPPTLIGPDGEQIPLPPEVYEALRHVVRVMAHGKAVTIAPHNLLLTTQEAAALLGISRPTLVTLLERGDIPCTRPNRHRRVQLIDVLAYQQRASTTRRTALATMTEISDELGLYEDESQPPLQR